MFVALEPIFNQIYNILNAEFYTKKKTFRTFEKGFQYKQRKIINEDVYPWGFLDWGKTGRVGFYRAPRVFKYNIVYPLVLITYGNEANQDNLIYNNSSTSNPGIGNLITDITDYFWGAYGNNNLIAAPANNQWNVIGWTIDQVREPSLSYVRPLLVNPFIRAAQIDLNVEVAEVN